MGHVRHFLTLLVCYIPLLVSAGSLPPQNSVTIVGFESAGSGCPTGSVLHDISPDAQVITLIFSEYQLAREGTKHPYGAHKSCRMKIQFDVPPGWSYTLNQLSVQGGVDLEPGLAAEVRLSYWTGEDRRPQQLKPQRFAGPVVKDYTFVRQFTDDVRWSSCDRHRQVGHELVLDSTASIYPTCHSGRNALGVMTIDAMENVIVSGEKSKAIFQSNLRWRRCR